LILLLLASGCTDIETWLGSVQSARTVLQDYRIVYAIAPNALPDNHVVAPEKIRRDMGAMVANDWESALAADTLFPIQLLIIHQSALPFVDKAWVQAAYGRGVVISFINVPLDQRLEVLGMTCRQGKYDPAPMETMGDFFMSYSFKVTAEPEVRQEVFEAYQQCQDIESIRFSGQVSRGGGGDTLELPESYRLYLGHLQSRLWNLNQ
jgi:hypothetical protein